MEPPFSSETEIPHGEASIPLSVSSQLALTPHYIIAPEEIIADRDSPLGVGRRNGGVFKGFWNNSLVGIRILSNDTPVDKLLERVQVWQALRHPHVLQVFGISPSDADLPYIVSQYYPNGNANEFLAENPSADRANIMFECALGMQYLHGRGLVHGGLKPTNILIAANGQICVADYGLIEIMPSGNTCAHRYFSPEAWKGTISRPSDVYAFAMSAYEIFLSTPPWGFLSESLIYQLVVREDDRPDRSDFDTEQRCGLTDQTWGIMEAAWQKEARLRPSFTRIVETWYSRSAEDPPVISRPLSPSNNVELEGLSSRLAKELTLRDSQRNPSRPQTCRSNTDSHSISSTSSSPPAYCDTSTGGSGSSQPLRLTHSLHIQPATSTNIDTNSIADEALWSSVLLQRPRNEGSSTPSTSTFLDSDKMTYLSLGPPSHRRNLSLTTAGLSSTYHPSQSPRMSSVDESVLDAQYTLSGIQHDPFTTSGKSNAILLTGALHAEVTEGRKQEVIDDYLHRVQLLCSQSDKEAQRLVTAGIVPTVILLLRSRALGASGLETALITLGMLACDPITANTIYRTNTTTTLIEIINSSDSDNTVALSIWCISRICRSSEVAAGVIKQDLPSTLIHKGLTGGFKSSCLSSWCLGTLALTDHLAEVLAARGVVNASVDHLRRITLSQAFGTEDICAALYVIARIARSIALAKSLVKAGCVPLIVHHLSTSEEPQILHWSARAIGCLMRPNASDIAKTLLNAGSTKALARIPRILPIQEIEPIVSFAFTIQRFSVAEWGAGTRKTLVEDGVVDSLLSVLRASVDVPNNRTQFELALAVSFLCDVGGLSIRKEIVRAGGIEILQRVGAAGSPEVTRQCNLAVTSITGNLWTRNAASAKSALSHNWNGGCPDYDPPCPLSVVFG